MSEQPGFSRQWFTWRRARRPVEHFRAGNRGAPLYEVECAIDHLVSSVNSLGAGYLEGKEWDYAGLVAHRLDDLGRIEASLDAVAVDPGETAEHRGFLATTRDVLEIIGRGR